MAGTDHKPATLPCLMLLLVLGAAAGLAIDLVVRLVWYLAS